MVVGRNQHFIPQYYFRYFNDGGKKINLLRRSNGQIVRGASVKHQASTAFFYGDARTEHAIAEIERSHRQAVQVVRTRLSMTTIDSATQSSLREAVAFQLRRTEAERRRSERVMDALARLQCECRINTAPPSEEISQLREGLKSGQLLVKVNPQHTQASAMRHALQYGALALSDMSMALLKDETGEGFAFGDSPVALYNRAAFDIKHFGVLGYQCRGLQILFPLGPSLTLLMYDSAVYRIRDQREGVIQMACREDVNTINKLQLYWAAEAVYFGDYMDGEYARRLWAEESPKLQLVEQVIHQGPAIVDGRQKGEILHTFLPQVDYRLDLSFIEYEPFTETTAFGVRSRRVADQCLALSGAWGQTHG